MTLALVRIGDYPQLKLIAWDRAPSAVLSELEAFDLYESHWLHVDQDSLTEDERAFIQSLANDYGNGVLNVPGGSLPSPPKLGEP